VPPGDVYRSRFCPYFSYTCVNPKVPNHNSNTESNVILMFNITLVPANPIQYYFHANSTSILIPNIFPHFKSHMNPNPQLDLNSYQFHIKFNSQEIIHIQIHTRIRKESTRASKLSQKPPKLQTRQISTRRLAGRT